LVESRTSGKFYAAKAFSKETPEAQENDETRKLKVKKIDSFS